MHRIRLYIKSLVLLSYLDQCPGFAEIGLLSL